MEKPGVIPRMLSGLLWLGMAFLAISFAVLAFVTLIMLFPNGLRDQIFAGVDAAKPMVNPQNMALICLGMLVIAAAWFFVLRSLRKVVGTVIAGDPFVPENISRLRRIWVIIAASEVFRMFIQWLAKVNATGASETDFRLETWFLVFVVAALAEAFRYGAALRRDQELTI